MHQRWLSRSNRTLELGPLGMACHIANKCGLAFLILENIDLANVRRFKHHLKGFCKNRYTQLNYLNFNCGIEEGKNLVIIGTYNHENKKFWYSILWHRHLGIIWPHMAFDFYEKRKAEK